jgi:aldehyde:ferredoxin oxidoreductase
MISVDKRRSTSMKGYMGKILRVDLSTARTTEERLHPDWADRFLGGTGLGVRYAYAEIPPEADPLGPQSKLILMTGPVTGTVLGTAGRFQVVHKSPLTGILCDSSSSGFWGGELKRSGYDGLIIEGESPTPVYLYIHNGQAELREASHLWGMDTYQVQEVLQEEVGDKKARVLCIGPAGEQGVLYSSVINDEGRTAGRGGNGAVFGRKRLKAIVVRGDLELDLADEKSFREFALSINKINAKKTNLEMLRTVGTAGVMDRWPLGGIPTKNWAKGSYEELSTKLSGAQMRDTILVKHPSSCHYCPIHCSRWVKIKTEAYRMEGPGPEYETLGALGSLCLVDDQEAVAYAGHLCNLYGMDTISCGATIAFAMECYEKGLITKEDTGGLELTWGNKDALIEAVKQIAHGEGIGELLRLGTRKAAEEIGGGSHRWAVHVKGMELPMHDPRVFYAWATTFTTSPRGACHLHGHSALYEHNEDPLPEWGLTGFYPRNSNEGKGKIARLAQNWMHVIDSMVMCFFASILLDPSDLATLIGHATGRQHTPQDLSVMGDRIDALYRAYNYECGIRRQDERLPERIMTPMPDGGAAGQVPDLDYQLREYYELRRLEPDGKPSYDSLVELGLPEIAQDLYS